MPKFCFTINSLAVLFTCISSSVSLASPNEPNIINFLGPGIYQGTTYSFLELGLKKGNAFNGNFKLQKTRDMTLARALLSLKNKAYPNAIRRFEARKEIMQDKDLIPIRFPVYAGSYGHRICYVNSESSGVFSTAGFEELKKFNFGMVKGWKDIEILRHNDFKVSQNNSVSGLYKQLAVGRVDTVCRGAIEIDYEREISAAVKGIQLDNSKIIVYNMPFFYFVHKDDKKLAEQLESGLIAAYNDGSYHQLWKDFYEKSLTGLNLESRRIVRLKSPIDQFIPFDYQHFMPHFMSGSTRDQTRPLGSDVSL